MLIWLHSGGFVCSTFIPLKHRKGRAAQAEGHCRDKREDAFSIPYILVGSVSSAFAFRKHTTVISRPFLLNQTQDVILTMFTFLNQTLSPALPFHDQVILYSGDRAYEDYYAPMKGRVHFNSADPKNGDASINVTGLKSSDSGTYQCKVKKAPGIRSRKMLLIVMGRWSSRYSRTN